MVILVLVSAVTLSPAIKVKGVRSCASTLVDLSEVFITGLDGPIRIFNRSGRLRPTQAREGKNVP